MVMNTTATIMVMYTPATHRQHTGNDYVHNSNNYDNVHTSNAQATHRQWLYVHNSNTQAMVMYTPATSMVMYTPATHRQHTGNDYMYTHSSTQANKCIQFPLMMLQCQQLL